MEIDKKKSILGAMALASALSTSVGYACPQEIEFQNCAGCHSGGSFSYSAAWSSIPSVIERNSTDSITFSMSGTGASGGGFSAEVSGASSTLTATGEAQVSSTNVSHSSVDTSSPFSWTFTFNSGSTSGTATLQAYGNPVNGNRASNTNSSSLCGGTGLNTGISGDGNSGSSFPFASTTIDINNAPSVSPGSGSVNFTEDGGAVTIASALNIIDTESTSESVDTMNDAQVTISGNYTSTDGDALNISSATCTANGLSCSGSGTQTINFSGGPESIDEYEAVLRAITFSNTSNNPSTSTRTITFSITDEYNRTRTGTRTVTVTRNNDIPTTSGWTGTTNYTEGDGTNYEVIDSAISLSDVDSSFLNRAEIELTSSQSNDELACPSSSISGITCIETSSTFLTFSGTATLANYELAIEGARFRNTSSNPSTASRTVTMRVRDSSNAYSSTASKSINVIAVSDPPEINNLGSDISFTEDAAIGTLVASAVTVSDIDSTNCNQAIVEVFNNQSDQDVLEYTGSVTGITDSFIATTGTLTLSGTATCANYGLALQTVRYSNTSQNPNTDNRTVNVSARDDGNTTSSLASKTIFVIATNDNPVAVDDTFTVADGSSDNQLDVIGTTGGGQDSDPENDSLSINSFSPSSLGATITIGGNCSANTICYTPPANFSTVDSFTYTLSDGNGGTSNSATVTISPPDTDNDGVAQAIDNCPSVSNADQLDSNSDGKGDACETDLDEDGVFDSGLLFTVTQDGMQGLTAFQDIVDSMVSIQVDFIDSQLDLSNIVYDWSASDNEIFSILSVNNSRAEFDAADSQLDAGVYKLAVTLSEGNVSITDSVFINVLENTPSFFDCDGDGIDDGSSEANTGDCDGDSITNITESYGDSDYDGIPDYLDDSNLTSNIGFDQYNDLNSSFEISTNDGLTLRKGETATYANRSGLGISLEDIENFGGNGGSAVTTSDDEFDHIGGIFSFEISGVTPGDSADIIIPLTTQLPPNALYRKFIDGNWTDFVTDANNQIMSAPYQTTLGICPPIDHSSYSSGLNAFDACLQLTIEDGGPNDVDNLANGVIRDPSGPAIATNGTSRDNLDEVEGSGSLAWLELLLLVSLLNLQYSRQSHRK